MTIKDNSCMQKVTYGVLSTKINLPKMIESSVAFGKKIQLYDGLKAHAFFNSCWLLDGNAFQDMPAPKFMKLDAITLGGLEVLALLPTQQTDPELVKELQSSNLSYTPIGFLDLHKIADGIFSTSGLGVAKTYQNNGLSKHIIAAACQIAGIKELTIPTQLSNSQAHKAWMHLAPLKIVSADVPHEKPDTIIYHAKIPEDIQSILKPIAQIGGKKVAFDEVKSHIKGMPAHFEAYVMGYGPDQLSLEYEPTVLPKTCGVA